MISSHVSEKLSAFVTRFTLKYRANRFYEKFVPSAIQGIHKEWCGFKS